MLSTLNNKTVAHVTLGCKVNMYDTQAMVEILENHGCRVVDFEECADIYIINTCTVTNFGDKKSRQALKRAAKRNPKAVIVACGCYSQIEPETVKKIEGVCLLLGTQERKHIAKFIIQYLENKEQKNFVSKITNQREFEDLNISTTGGKARANIKIQEGCDRYCAYCIIPYVRGPVRSRRPESIIREAERLARLDCKEIVLAGICLAGYGKDLEDMGLDKLLYELNEIEGIERIRLGSVEPLMLTDKLLETMGRLPKMCDHLHISLQSGCDKTLKAMNRRYSTEQYKTTVDKLRAILPKVGVTTDIIVGFPGETDNDFKESLEFAGLMEFSRIHVFPYSAKAGTKAAAMNNQISAGAKEQRAKEMGKLAAAAATKFSEKFEHKKLRVLFEQKIGKTMYEGHSTNYITFRQESDVNIENQILEVEAAYVKEGCLYGNVLTSLRKT